MWPMIAYGVIATIGGVVLILWAYWYFVVAPDFEAFRREMETAREGATWRGRFRDDVDELQGKHHAATSEEVRKAS